MSSRYENLDRRSCERIALAKQTKAPVGVGAFLPGNVLLIGEQASDPLTAPEQQAFCDTKGCSGWLNKQLEAEGIPEGKLFWLNALNNDHSYVDLKKVVEELRPSLVIALGGVAQRACRDQGVAHVKSYHPQYWKRFQAKQRYPLLDQLCQALKQIPTNISADQSVLQSTLINKAADDQEVAVS